MKVKVHLTLQYEDEKTTETVDGIYKEEEKELVFFDTLKNAMHFYVQNHLFVRITEESIFSYHFEGDAHLEIYIKEYRKGTRLPLHVSSYELENQKLKVIYQVEGNDSFHTLQLEWR